MERARSYLGLLAAGVFLVSGCGAEALLVAGGTAVGAGTGTYFYISGELKTDYNVPFEKAWAACEKTVADMRGVDVKPSKSLSKGIIDTIIEGENVRFTVSYKAKDTTSVAIRVGVFGERPSSQRLHDMVGENLVKD